ncbi:hypothetical protein MKEN_00278200 [Mycena kentingensis (nom. inval.)]|nr:hypothetical protein MKEN_00278200 [Mycena kentingensis (nom. inval.)]
MCRGTVRKGTNLGCKCSGLKPYTITEEDGEELVLDECAECGHGKDAHDDEPKPEPARGPRNAPPGTSTIASDLQAIMLRHSSGIPVKTSTADARKETNSGFRPSGSSSKPKPTKALIRIGFLMAIVCGLVRNENGLYSLRDSRYPRDAYEEMVRLGLILRQEDAFSVDWNVDEIDAWFRRGYKQLLEYLDFRYPDEKRHWFLARKQGQKLVLVDRPAINGAVLQEVRGLPSQGYRNHGIHFVLKHQIPLRIFEMGLPKAIDLFVAGDRLYDSEDDNEDLVPSAPAPKPTAKGKGKKKASEFIETDSDDESLPDVRTLVKRTTRSSMRVKEEPKADKIPEPLFLDATPSPKLSLKRALSQSPEVEIAEHKKLRLDPKANDIIDIDASGASIIDIDDSNDDDYKPATRHTAPGPTTTAASATSTTGQSSIRPLLDLPRVRYYEPSPPRKGLSSSSSTIKGSPPSSSYPPLMSFFTGDASTFAQILGLFGIVLVLYILFGILFIVMSHLQERVEIRKQQRTSASLLEGVLPDTQPGYYPASWDIIPVSCDVSAKDLDCSTITIQVVRYEQTQVQPDMEPEIDAVLAALPQSTKPR